MGKGVVYTPSLRYICVYLFRIWCLAFVLSAFIVFILSLYHPSTGFKIFSKSAYSINGTLNWYCPSWNFNHFFFIGHIDHDVTIAVAVLIVRISCWLCTKTVEAVHAIVIRALFFRLTLLRTWIYSWLRYNTCFHPPVLSITCFLHFPLRPDLRTVYIFLLIFLVVYQHVDCYTRIVLF